LRHANHHFSRTVAALVFCLPASHASAETVAETVTHWGLIGAWSLDCALPADHGNGALLIYETTADGGVIHVRDFGDAREENKVLSADVSRDGMLNLRVFSAIRQTREVGFIRLNDDSVRAMYNRDEKNRYSIRGGKFTLDGRPRAVQHKCEKPAG
jgi:hypothetical protein